jgi:hypothetical protein
MWFLGLVRLIDWGDVLLLMFADQELGTTMTKISHPPPFLTSCSPPPVPLRSRIEPGTMETTYMADISHQIATRYLGPTASIAPGEKGQLYARHIFKPEVLPRVSAWLVAATEQERDAFRNAFASLTTYYKRRKGPRSELSGRFFFLTRLYFFL